MHVHRVRWGSKEGENGREGERRSTGGNSDKARWWIKESGGGRERADPRSGGRDREIAPTKCKERERERVRDGDRGSEWEEGERRTLLRVERDSNVEKEEVGPRARDEESEW